MLILLPLLTFAALFLVLLGREVRISQSRPWQGSFLLASALWGAAVVVITEGLSLFTAIGGPGVVAGWTLVLLGALVWGRSKGFLAAGWRRLHSLLSSLNKFEVTLLAVVGVMALVLLAVVFAAPVNTVDVLQYHMPRVLQWAQNGSLEHFSTTNVAQNSRPYWGEGVSLHMRLLWGSDDPVELVNWLAWLGTAIAASGLARALKINRSWSWLAAVLVLTIPTSVLHATTAMVDLPAAFWALSLGYFVARAVGSGLGGPETLGLGLSLALGMLTKGTFFPFGAALMGLWVVFFTREFSLRRTIARGVIVALVVVVINTPFWLRNIQSFGGPYGSSLPIQRIAPGALVEGSATTEESIPPDGAEGRAVNSSRVSRIVRMAGVHFVTPFGSLNQMVFQRMEDRPDVFPGGYTRSMKLAAWNNALTGGSPLHFVIILASLAVVIVPFLLRERAMRGLVLGFGIALLTGLALLSLIDYGVGVFAVRYQLPFLAVGGVLVAWLLGRLPGWAAALACVGLVTYALPYLLLNQTRPVIGMTPWPTKVDSVFVEEPARVLFAQSPEIQDEYRAITSQVVRADCRNVGLMLRAKDLEYTMWWFLAAPESGRKMQHLRGDHQGGFWRRDSRSMCAIICTRCEQEDQVYGLDLKTDAGHVKLFSLADVPTD